jgi:two-component system, NarL family, nitrate/nitrite response regulator NarL
MKHERRSSRTGAADLSTTFGRPVTIVVADNEWMFRASLRQLLTAPPPVVKDVYGVDIGDGFKVVGESGSGLDTMAIVEATKPDLLLLDIDLPQMSGLDVIRGLQPFRGTMRTIILAGVIKRADLLKAVQLGVRGVVLKDAATEVLFEAIVSVLTGRCWLDQALVADLMEIVSVLPDPATTPGDRRPFGLTRREREVLTLVAAGYPNKEIAKACAVSEETIKHHLTRIFDKVGASNRLELAVFATESGLITGSVAPSPSTGSSQAGPAPQVLRNLVTSG